MLFSVIIPVYNTRKDYLIECLTSLRDQTSKGIEIVIIDDGSNIDTAKLCDTLPTIFPELKIKVLHQKNSGQLEARYLGIQESTGDYCLFLDSDDFLRNDTIKTLSKVVESYHADMIFFEGVRYSNGNTFPFWEHYSNKTILFDGKDLEEIRFKVITTSRFNNICFKAIKREFFLKTNRYKDIEYIRGEEDYLMQLPIFDQISSLLYIPEDFYFYRINTASVSFAKFDINKFKSAKFIYNQQIEYSTKWNLKNFEVPCRRHLMSSISVSIRQIKKSQDTFNFTQKIDYLKSISEDSLFRSQYVKFDGKINSLVAKLVLKLLYHRCIILTLLVCFLDPRIHEK